MTQHALEDYLAHLEAHPNRFGRTVSPSTIRATRADLQGFVRWWEQHHRLAFEPSLVLERDVRDWQQHRQEEDGARPSTINRASASLRGFFAWAETEGLISHNPATELHVLPLEEQAPRGISLEAVNWLFRVASDQKDKMARARDELEQVARELGEVSPHRLRHGLAHRLCTSGADLGYIQSILGHQHLATTMRYGKPNDPDLRAAISRANGSSAK
jgi:site-specific recombinase XerD